MFETIVLKSGAILLIYFSFLRSLAGLITLLLLLLLHLVIFLILSVHDCGRVTEQVISDFQLQNIWEKIFNHLCDFCINIPVPSGMSILIHKYLKKI